MSDMNVKGIAFIGYPVADMQRSRDFFEGVLGLTMARHWGELSSPSWAEYDIGGHCLAIIPGGGDSWPSANGGPAVALEVDDFPGYVAKLKAAGVCFAWEPEESKICWMAMVLDPDNNRVLIHHRKTEEPN